MGHVFDLDGTLVDSTPTLVKTINTVLERHGYPLTDEKENLLLAGWGLMHMFRETAYDRTGDDRLADALADEMLEVYREDPVTGTVSYPGAYECLKELTGRGEPVAVITNKHLEPAMMILKNNFPDIVFSKVYTPDQGYEPKPSKMSLIDFRKNYSPDFVSYLGDTELDYETAWGTADEVRLALWGYRGREKLRRKGIPEELMIDDFSQVAE